MRVVSAGEAGLQHALRPAAFGWRRPRLERHDRRRDQRPDREPQRQAEQHQCRQAPGKAGKHARRRGDGTADREGPLCLGMADEVEDLDGLASLE